MVTNICLHCGREYELSCKAKLKTSRYCSRACKYDYFRANNRGENSTRWKGGERSKVCKGCGVTFHHQIGRPLICFQRQKYCTKQCADQHGFRYSGEKHPNWKGGRQVRNMTKQLQWARKIFERDDYTCQDCGKRGGDLQAHHIKGFTDYPDLRWELSNGQTLCKPCHYKTYRFYRNQYSDIANGVNSAKL